MFSASVSLRWLGLPPHELQMPHHWQTASPPALLLSLSVRNQQGKQNQRNKAKTAMILNIQLHLEGVGPTALQSARMLNKTARSSLKASEPSKEASSVLRPLQDRTDVASCSIINISAKIIHPISLNAIRAYTEGLACLN